MVSAMRRFCQRMLRWHASQIFEPYARLDVWAKGLAHICVNARGTLEGLSTQLRRSVAVYLRKPRQSGDSHESGWQCESKALRAQDLSATNQVLSIGQSAARME